MGAVLGLPLLGGIAGLAGAAGTACIGGVAFFCTSQAASALTKSCNCNSSLATRVGFSLIFLFNSIFSWIMLTDWAVKLLANWSFDYIKMSCEEGRCYGVLAVHRIGFALAMFHAILGLLLIGVKDTRVKRAAIQNGWWGPKVGIWIVFVVLSFFIPNSFFIFYSSYISLPGAAFFILIGLVLLVDFAHSWSETCLEKWEQNEESNFWKYILIGSTLGLFVIQMTLVVIQYVFFAGSGCGLNQFFITFNLLLSILVTIISVLPSVQSANPRSGLAQSGMVVAYTAYLVTSAIANHDDDNGGCNPLQERAAGARTGMVILGAIFTFLAIAYSTSRAATQSVALAGNAKKSNDNYGPISLSNDEEEGGIVRTQPGKKETLRYQALQAAVAAGSLPASALEEEDSEDEDGDGVDKMDDERAGTKYNYSWFHVIFILATMYTAMLLTNWNAVTAITDLATSDGSPIKIGRSHVALWVRIISSWACFGIYGWSLVAPVVMPDRFGSD